MTMLPLLYSSCLFLDLPLLLPLFLIVMLELLLFLLLPLLSAAVIVAFQLNHHKYIDAYAQCTVVTRTHTHTWPSCPGLRKVAISTRTS